MTFVNILIGILAFLIGLLSRQFLPSYFRKKGENLATKEDITELTNLQKGVEHRFNELIENSKQRHELRLAALDQRLAAHQKAFSLWRELLADVHSERIGPVVLRCQAWWEENCLYLEPSVRDAFVRAYSAASSHHQYTQARFDAKDLQANWAEVTRFPNILFEAMQLPPIQEDAAKKALPELTERPVND
ncbi:hypothetical protein [Burkholderia multivorans]|uniref:Uncharacterized protein n=1 Tax=Burkholderia multivorans TaxID=87883 RepID=A0AB37AN66_9BURK|nr:hypothetical protein [Burkholderia multivorans]MBU9589606.1 hypothetical protein [Burkholderia multivorans]PRE39317.1 hypothetical protein C6P97_31025 [Burkholderia multivorans]PRE42264.1 hypothetical protein C6P99_24580 [Burkholderia multivorans]